MKKRILSLLLVFTMLLGMVPGVTTAEAAGDRVHVIVENTTFTPDNAEELGATWEETFWQGTLVDTWVAIDESSTMMGCVVTALEAEGYTQTGAENNYISDINGLGEFDGGYMSGWMGTLNDWFTNQGFGAYTVADGTLEAGDEIRIMYTTAYGDDLGGSWGNSDTTVKELTFSEGELDPAFDKDTHAYTLTIPDGTASVVVTPTASNKNYQVRTRIGDTVYKRTADVPVADGTEIIVECNWPGSLSMNEGGEHQTYTITVAANTPSHDVHTLVQVEAVAATCTEKGTLEHWHCSGCGKNFADADGAEELATVETAIDPDNHTGVATEWSKDATGHWHVCSACQAQVDKASHNPGPAATETTPQICTVCEYVIDPATGHVEHTADTTWHSDETHHWHLCTGCGEEMDKAPHTGGKATHEELAVCEICGRGYGELEKYIITAHAGEGGRISPSGRVEVEPGEDQRFDIIPRSGYEIEEVWVDDEPMGAIDTYRFRDVDDDHSIDVTFASAADLPDYGRVVGEVYVSVENRTFPGGDFTGTLVSGWYDLCEDDTMMTCILKALAEDGYTWEGTGGKTKDGYDITYLAYIKKGSKSLGEFDGEQGSGWMGTLNDWFVNLSFQEFAVGGKGDNALEDGDVIQVMYTQNYGADIGGTWNSADTSLKDLTVSGGKLSPRFDSDVLTYELEISGSSAKVLVTPTASNKNYQVKTFLNAYNKDSAFYKRSERITVRPGDIIYVGCGDPSWASMNNQGDEAIDYSGTKYIIYVGGADLQSRIDQLPSARKITYKNYKDYVDLVAQLRKEYDKLSNPSKIDAEKLLAVEEKLAFFIEIDEVKDLLAKIPAGDRLTAADEKKVRAAGDAYNQLSREQQAYITASELANYQAALLYFGSEGEVAETVRFADVTAANWFYDDVQYVAVNGLMDGTASGRFEPYSQMTRAMLVTVLYRLEGSPSVRGTNSFSDVAQNKWYTNAVIWAAQNGIVNGLDESTFGTDSSVTREQMAAILYRYAGYRGYDTSGSRSISAFADAGKAAGYAVKAMEWTYSEGLIHGRSSTELAPKGTATRAEVAAILHRFSEKIGAR